MIDAAISHIAKELNQCLKEKIPERNEDVVVISNILEQDGTVASHVNNKIVVSLVNIEKDTVPFRQLRAANSAPDRSVVTPPPVFLNIYLMFAGYFSGGNYQEGLKCISNTVGFFQGRPVFDHQNSPDLDGRIDKLVLEIENLTIRDLSSLWGVLSGRYLPSILYKVRMVSIDSGAVRKQTPALKKPMALLNH